MITPKIGGVLVKEFFIVGFVPDAGPGVPDGFFICGGGGVSHSPFDTDTIKPCIGTSRSDAERQFELARSEMKGLGAGGSLVLIKFCGGVVERMESVVVTDQVVIKA